MIEMKIFKPQEIEEFYPEKPVSCKNIMQTFKENALWIFSPFTDFSHYYGIKFSEEHLPDGYTKFFDKIKFDNNSQTRWNEWDVDALSGVTIEPAKTENFSMGQFSTPKIGFFNIDQLFGMYHFIAINRVESPLKSVFLSINNRYVKLSFSSPKQREKMITIAFPSSIAQPRFLTELSNEKSGISIKNFLSE